MNIYSVLIISNTHEQLLALNDFDLDLKHHLAARTADGRFSVPALVTDEQREALTAAGYEVQAAEDLTATAEQRATEVSPYNRFADARSLAAFEERAVLGYMTPAEIDSALQNLALLHPDLVTLISLPFLTWEGRTCYAVRLRGGPLSADGSRPGVLFTGSMHAREWGGADTCVSFLTRLIAAYRAGASLAFGGKTFTPAQVQAIVEHVDLFVFPNVNPDGKAYSQSFDPGAPQNTWWRKNRNPNPGAAQRGVDLNRNFDFLWGSGIGTSANPASPTYKGAAAFSEPEARNVRHLFETYPHIRCYVDIHSYGELLLYSWGDDDNQTSSLDQTFTNPTHDGRRGVPGDTLYREFIPTLDQNTVVGLARRMNQALSAVRGRSYTVQQAVGLYPTSATSDDYSFARHRLLPAGSKVFGYTIEFGRQFVPPIAEMQNIINEVAAAMTELCWAVTSDVFIRDNPTDTGAGSSTGPFWNSPDVWVRNADDGGAAHQDTLRGQDNFLYVRVHNRGLADATQVTVRAYLASFAGTQFLFPNDWVPRNPGGGGSLGGPGTYLIGEAQIPVLAPGASQVVSLRWPAALIPPEANWHPCLLVEAAPNDGATLSGSHVWQNNNLAQKNLTIINARRGELVDFPFRFGSPHRVEPVTEPATAELVIQKFRVPHGMPIYLDLLDDALLETLRLEPEPATGGAVPASTPDDALTGSLPRGGVLEAQGVQIRLLQETSLSMPIALGGSGSPTPYRLRLPAGTQVEIRGEAAERLFTGPGRPLGGGMKGMGFSLVQVDGRPMLHFAAPRVGRLRLPLKPGEPRPMRLRLQIPPSAAPGDRCSLQVIQYNAKKQPVGGLTIEVVVRE